MPNFDLGDYVDVRERLAWFFQTYPDGSLQADILERGEGYVVIKAVAYRSPMDDRPGTGMASEPFPGRTPYTKDSEVMVGETSAWGRALAAIGAPTKGGVASAQEVANRTSGAVAGGPPNRSAQDPAPGATSGEKDGGPVSASSLPGTEAREAGSATSAVLSPGPTSAHGEGAATEPGEGQPKPSPGSTKDAPGPPHYASEPSACNHKGRSGHLLRPRSSPRGPVCPRCGLSYITVTEGTSADLGAP